MVVCSVNKMIIAVQCKTVLGLYGVGMWEDGWTAPLWGAVLWCLPSAVHWPHGDTERPVYLPRV